MTINTDPMKNEIIGLIKIATIHHKNIEIYEEIAVTSCQQWKTKKLLKINGGVEL